MKLKIEALKKEIEEKKIQNQNDLENFRILYLGSKNCLKPLFDDFKNVPNQEKKEIGVALNELKKQAQIKFDTFAETIEKKDIHQNKIFDLTQPIVSQKGGQHPLHIVKAEIINIFEKINFMLSEGPEIEDDWHNFSALNFAENHPARDMQDTFFIENPNIALRTHTSSVQVRTMENQQPPIRTISPGRVYRNEAISARAHCFFHQIEGLYIDKNVSFADLKQTLLYFAQALFGKKTDIRLRASYFPFTEISAEVDVTCMICHAKGCNVCKQSGWVEILGCGMVHPNVLKNCNIDTTIYSGFAFGMGLERITMLKYGINDLRLFSENDVRFIKQFS